MIATDFKLIPLAVLSKHESAVLRDLDALPIRYQKNLLDEPEIRYAFVYYALLTHWPELLNGDFSADELLYNRLYWFIRLSKQYQKHHDFDAGFEQQAVRLMESASGDLGVAVVQEIEDKVLTEIATNEREIAVVLTHFHLQLHETGDFFATVAPVLVSTLLQETLRENTPLALAMGTEKARSEFIIAPVLSEVRRQLANAISLFSGVEMDVDSTQGLRGEFDFLLCRSPHQLILQAPIIAVVEAKKEDMTAGIGQCLAEMIAARIFNQQNHNDIPTIYGVVTTGSIWKFLRLIDASAYVDVTEYYIKDVERIVGIIVSMFTSSGVPRKP
jgi:hypothetical protein